jgi:hypothetical protein
MGLTPKNARTYMATRAVAIVLFAAACAAAGSASASDPDRFLWKSVPAAQCRLDDKIPLAWNVYLLGRRFLAMDLHAKQVYNVPLTDLKASGSNWESGDLFVESRILPTENWTLRDVGPAELIKLTLKDYNRFLQIELPHPTDLRGLY